ncbi:hypothetical protein NM688_g1675 [Phlebia brevispora]|uniref:Uncharacterized protein n=1 Tax=Phlebia brevispora TaxID=194682 RepID=A0ACC1TAF1_9APHY|nr:hypothetical protein NM688_g1675 [Phlebia brevispora]
MSAIEERSPRKRRAKTPPFVVPRPKTAPRTKPSGCAYVLWVIVSVILAAVLYYQSTGKGKEALGSESVDHLPDSYAICKPGKIYTVDDSKPKVDCILVLRDEIAATGTLDDIHKHWDEYQNEQIRIYYGNEPKAKKTLKVISPRPNSIIVPGLSDAHAHLVEYGLKMQLPLDKCDSITDVLDTLEAYVRAHPEIENDPTQWVEGWGWDQTRWEDWSGRFPTAADLASRPGLANVPMSLRRSDGHAVWISYAAINITLAKLPGQRWPSNDDIDGGEIVRDSNDNPTGIFLDNAILLVQSPPWTEHQIETYFERAMNDALRVGLTTVHDAFASESFLQTFQKMADEGRMPIRVYGMGGSENTTYWGKGVPKLENYGEDGHLNVKSVKLFTDGALGSWGAAMLEPYSDKPDTTGIMRSSPEALEGMVTKFWEDGWSTNIHCIGDRANKVVLDIYERLLTKESVITGESVRDIAAKRRPRIEHAQIMRMEDLSRVGRLGIITSVQPTHATSDMWYAEKRLGPVRIKGAYAYQTLLQTSPLNILPLGSDFPVEGINPLLGFYAAVSRLDIKGNSPHGAGGWYGSEKLTRAQALKGATLDAAYASFSENILGSLEPGKKADYVVLDRDIMNETAPVRDILRTRVLATVIDGKIAFGSI